MTRKPLNVFTPEVQVGQIAMVSAAGPVSTTVMIDPESSDTITPGLPLMLVAGDSKVPMVDLATPGTDEIYGLALYNPKYSSWEAGDVIQVTSAGTVVYLKSAGSLDRGDKVGLHATTFKLIAATDDNFIGVLLDDAGSDEIIRVELAVPLMAAPIAT